MTAVRSAAIVVVVARSTPLMSSTLLRSHEVDREVALDRDRELRQQVLVLLAGVEQHVLAQRLGLVGIGGLDLGDLRDERRVEMLGDVGVLGETLHRLPQVQLLLLERGVVLAQLVLAVVERLDDRVEMRLRRLVAVEVVAELVAERDQAQQLVGAGGLLRVEVLDRAPQVHEGRRDLAALGERTLLHGPDRRGEQPVRRVGRGLDVGVAHLADVGRLLREGGAVHVERHDALDVGGDLLVQRRQRRGVDRHHAGRLRRGDRGHRLGRGERELGVRWGQGLTFSAHRCSSAVLAST